MRLPAWLRGTVTGDVVIHRPVPDVYRFYRDFTNLPHVVGDVVAVTPVADNTYRWVVAGPFGTRLPMTVTVTEERVDRLLRYRTSGPLVRGRWQLSFTPESAAGWTRVHEQLTIPLGAIGRAALALLGKFPDREVASNLTTLKQVLEVDDRSERTHRPPGAAAPRPVSPPPEGPTWPA